MSSITLPQQNNHIGWVDFMRIAACFIVVFSHCCDPFVGQFDKNYGDFLTGTLIGSTTRPCVPLFVMISGVLLLPIGMDTGSFYKRRLKKILIPLLIWSIASPLLYYVYFASGFTTSNANIVMADHTLSATAMKFFTFLFNFGYDTTPLWYLYMLVGIYLFMPIIGAWLDQASRKDVKRFLGIWFITLFLPYIQLLAPVLGYPGNYGNMGILGVCDWNAYGVFYYFSGFLGYVVLAYYLKKFPLDWSWGKTLGICVPLYLAGYAITAGGFIEVQSIAPGNYAFLEIIWNFAGINVFMMTFATFVILQKIRIRQSRWLTKLASLTFGVYLCHFFFVQCGYDLINAWFSLPAIVQIPVMAVLAFSASLLLTWLLSLSRWTRKSVM